MQKLAQASTSKQVLSHLSTSSSATTRCFMTRSSTVQQNYRRFGETRQPRSPPFSASSAASTSGLPIQIRLPNLGGMGGGRRGGGGGKGGFDPKGFFSRFRRPPALIVLGLGGGSIYYITNLERVERTGRLRFIDVTPEQEAELGKQSYQEIMNQYQRQIIPENHPTSRFVQDVVKRIVRANELHVPGQEGSRQEWETHVIRDDQKNAFVLPGGKIFVFSGILPIAGDADGLAVILGHEIAHQVARHSAERMSSLKVLFGLSILLESLGIDPGLSRVGLNLLMTLPNSRKNETEADFIGLQLASVACYDPRAAVGLWQRMEKSEGSGGGNMAFLSTHPSSHKRIEKVGEWAKEALELRPDRCGPLRGFAEDFKEVSKGRW